MKILKSALVVLMLSAAFVACKKDDVQPQQPAFSIEGTWEGKIASGSAIPYGQYALNIKPGGGLQRVNKSGSVSASGTWQLSGNSFSGNYNYASGTVVTFSATVDKAQKKISGSWQNNGGEQGTFYVTKSTP